MSRFPSLSIALVLICAVAVEAGFQRKPKRSSDNEPLMSHVDAANEMSRLRNVARLLYTRQAQLELGIGPSTQRAARDAALKVDKGFLDFHNKVQMLNSNVAGNKLVDEYRAKLQKHLEAVLTSKQIKRLHQIAIQRQRIYYFKTWDARVKLKVTSEQREELDKLFRKRNPKGAELSRQFREKKIDRKTYIEKSKQLQARKFQKALKILTPKQRKDYAKLIGKPFAW